MDWKWLSSTETTLRIFGLVPFVVVLMSGGGCSVTGESALIYRPPYADGTDVFVSRDHHTHSPAPNRLDLVGVNGKKPYSIVAAHPGTIRFIEDSNAANCCRGACGNNYVWIEHLGGEWTKYSHLATNSVTNDAELSVGDVVVAGTFLGYESNVGMACGTHLHFEVGVPNDPTNPLQSGNGGFINGTNRIPRFCGVPGEILEAKDVETASRCEALVNCIQSSQSPSTDGNCRAGVGDEVCVQEIQEFAATSTYQIGEHLSSSFVRIELDWCPNAECDLSDETGRAIRVTFVLDDPDDPNVDPISFIANCESSRIVETVNHVKEIIIQKAPIFSPENVVCEGNQEPAAFARWEICDLLPGLAPKR